MSEAVSSPPPKRGRRKEARPGELLDAALDLFVEKGFAATKVDEVAARAGVSKGTLFLYFPSKEELFKAVVRENIAGRFAEWGQTLADATGSSSEMLRYAFAQWWEHVGSTKAGGLAKLMFSEANNFPDITEFYRREVVVPGQELIAHILQRGMDSGEFRRIDMDYAIYLVQAPLMYLLLMQPTKSLCVANPENFSPEEYIRTQVDNLVLGLSRQPA